jgi:hypothetical protein
MGSRLRTDCSLYNARHRRLVNMKSKTMAHGLNSKIRTKENKTILLRIPVSAPDVIIVPDVDACVFEPNETPRFTPRPK